MFIYLHHLILGYAQTLGAPIYVFDDARFWTLFGLHVAYFLPFIGMMVYLSIWLRREGYELEQRVQDRTHELGVALDKLALAHNAVHSSIQYAARIQRAILPPEEYFRAMVAEHFVLWEPRDVVGGDIYWCRSWGDGSLIILGDCTGHGIPGAFMTLICAGALEQATKEMQPGDVSGLVQRMHAILQGMLRQNSEHGQSDDGIEMGVCYLDTHKSRMIFAGARFDLYVAESGRVNVIKGNKSGMGYRGIAYNQHYASQEISLNKNQIFYLVSDGIIDQGDVKTGWGVGRKRLVKWIEEGCHLSLEVQKVAIYNNLLAYQGSAKRRDDISMIGFKI